MLLGILSAWVTTGGAGTLTRISLQITQAALPMRGFTPRTSAGPATTFLVIRNLTSSPDTLLAVSSPIASHIALTERASPPGPRTLVSHLAIPANGTLTLTPLGDDVVLQNPSPYETLASVPLTLTFQHAGTVTINVGVTAPGTP